MRHPQSRHDPRASCVCYSHDSAHNGSVRGALHRDKHTRCWGRHDGRSSTLNLQHREQPPVIVATWSVPDLPRVWGGAWRCGTPLGRGWCVRSAGRCTCAPPPRRRVCRRSTANTHLRPGRAPSFLLCNCQQSPHTQAQTCPGISTRQQRVGVKMTLAQEWCQEETCVAWSSHVGDTARERKSRARVMTGITPGQIHSTQQALITRTYASVTTLTSPRNH